MLISFRGAFEIRTFLRNILEFYGFRWPLKRFYELHRYAAKYQNKSERRRPKLERWNAKSGKLKTEFPTHMSATKKGKGKLRSDSSTQTFCTFESFSSHLIDEIYRMYTNLLDSLLHDSDEMNKGRIRTVFKYVPNRQMILIYRIPISPIFYRMMIPQVQVLLTFKSSVRFQRFFLDNSSFYFSSNGACSSPAFELDALSKSAKIFPFFPSQCANFK